MAVHPYQALQSEYEGWVANCRPQPGRLREIDAVALRLTRPDHLAKFDDVRSAIGVPNVVQATICEREDGCDFSKSPAQGDPWNRVSTHVPKNIGPFASWRESAIYSWTKCDRLDVNSAPWSLPYACWKWEGYNGFGYRAHGVRTPYVVGGTNLQQSGKFVADGQWDPRHVDGQLGCLPVAMRMIEMVPRLAFGEAVAVASIAIVKAPPLQPIPDALGGSLTGAKWVQASLNLVEHLDVPLRVDGSYGRLTRAAVRRFQADHGMPATGLVDEAFCAEMDAALVAARPRA